MSFRNGSLAGDPIPSSEGGLSDYSFGDEFTAEELGYVVGKSGITALETGHNNHFDYQDSRVYASGKFAGYVHFPVRCGDGYDKADGTPWVSYVDCLHDGMGSRYQIFAAIDTNGIVWANGDTHYNTMGDGTSGSQQSWTDAFYTEKLDDDGDGVTKYSSTATRSDILKKRCELVEAAYYSGHPTLTGADITSDDGGTLPSRGKDPYPINPLMNSSGELIDNQNPTQATSVMTFQKAFIAGGASYDENVHDTMVALGTDGKIYTCGYGGNGQVGSGHSHGHNRYWKQVVNAAGNVLTNMTDIFHIGRQKYSAVFAIDSNGSVWAWGYNGHYQLGTNDSVNYPYAVKIYDCTDANKLPADNVPARRFICAEDSDDRDHVTYLGTDETQPRYYAWGEGDGCMFGAGHKNDLTIPTLMEHGPFNTNLFTVKKIFVDSGYQANDSSHASDLTGSTMCITQDVSNGKWRLWGAGSNPYGALGVPHMKKVFGTISDSGFMSDTAGGDDASGSERTVSEYFAEVPFDRRLIPHITSINLQNNHNPGSHYLGIEGRMLLDDGRCFWSGVLTYNKDNLTTGVDDGHNGIGVWKQGVWSSKD